MNWLGWAHFTLALAALGAGAAVTLRVKGDRIHRWVGRVYAGAMLGLNVTALMIYDLLGHFGPFHVAALLSLLTIVGGMIPVLTRRPRGKWMAHHAIWMAWSYVGLLAAAASESLTRWTPWGFWWTVLAATLVVCGAGWFVIRGRVPVILRRLAGPPG